MKIEETIINNKKFIKTTPSEGYLLHKIGTNEYYSEAIDLINSNFVYEEVEDLKPLIEQPEEIKNILNPPEEEPLPEQSE